MNLKTKDYFKGQFACYIEYLQPLSVALAILSINEIYIGDKDLIKCSFATSKCCSNFLKYSICDGNIK